MSIDDRARKGEAPATVGDTIGRPTLAGFAYPDECPFNVPPESIDSVQEELDNDPDYLEWLEARGVAARWMDTDHGEHDSNGEA